MVSKAFPSGIPSLRHPRFPPPSVGLPGYTLSPRPCLHEESSLRQGCASSLLCPRNYPSKVIRDSALPRERDDVPCPPLPLSAALGDRFHARALPFPGAQDSTLSRVFPRPLSGSPSPLDPCLLLAPGRVSLLGLLQQSTVDRGLKQRKIIVSERRK